MKKSLKISRRRSKFPHLTPQNTIINIELIVFTSKIWNSFNKLVAPIVIDKFKYGSKVEYLDLVIYKGNRLYEKGFFDIKIYQKEQNLYAYIPQKSNHRSHTIRNYVLNELKWYIKYNSEKLNFLNL